MHQNPARKERTKGLDHKVFIIKLDGLDSIKPWFRLSMSAHSWISPILA